MPHSTQIYTHSKHTHLLPSLASLHAKVITQDSTLSYFALPLSLPEIESWWASRAQDTVSGTRLLVISTTTPEPGPEEEEEPEQTTVAAALLSTPFTQTGPFRAVIEGVWVDPGERRKGLGAAVVRRMEEEGEARGRLLFMAEVEDEEVLRAFWEGLGYRKAGVVPDRGVSPKDGSSRDMAYYYKDLRDSPPGSS